MDARTGKPLAPCAYEQPNILPESLFFLLCAWEYVWEVLRNCLGEQEGDQRVAIADLCHKAREFLIECFYNPVISAISGNIIFILFTRELRFIRVELIDHSHEDYRALSLQSKRCVSKANVLFTVSLQWKYFLKETKTEQMSEEPSYVQKMGNDYSQGVLWELILLHSSSCALLQVHGWQSLACHPGVVSQAHSWRAQQTDRLVLGSSVPNSTASAA